MQSDVIQQHSGKFWGWTHQPFSLTLLGWPHCITFFSGSICKIMYRSPWGQFWCSSQSHMVQNSNQWRSASSLYFFSSHALYNDKHSHFCICSINKGEHANICYAQHAQHFCFQNLTPFIQMGIINNTSIQADLQAQTDGCSLQLCCTVVGWNFPPRQEAEKGPLFCFPFFFFQLPSKQTLWKNKSLITPSIDIKVSAVCAIK